MNRRHLLILVVGLSSYVHVKSDNVQELEREGYNKDDKGSVNPRSLILWIACLSNDACKQQYQTENVSDDSYESIALSSFFQQLISSKYNPWDSSRKEYKGQDQSLNDWEDWEGPV